MSHLILKRYVVWIDGYEGVYFYAKSRGQALGRAFQAYRVANDQITFKGFLKKKPLVRVGKPEKSFGSEIKVNPYVADAPWIDGYFIEKTGNTVRVAMPNCDRVRNYHELDVDLCGLEISK